MLATKRILATVSLSMLILVVPRTAQAKSVYVINDTVSSHLQVYKIEDVNLVHQKDYTCESDISATMGAVGIAIDTSDYGDFLFVTFENQNEIELVNGKPMII